MSFDDLPDLPRIVRELVQSIPPGRVTTYGDIAEWLGMLSAARWVATFLKNHDHDEDCVCHRVVRRTGELGGFILQEPDAKQRLLRLEGIRIRNDSIDLGTYRFTDLTASGQHAPLKSLLEMQQTAADGYEQEVFTESPHTWRGLMFLMPRECPSPHMLQWNRRPATSPGPRLCR